MGDSCFLFDPAGSDKGFSKLGPDSGLGPGIAIKILEGGFEGRNSQVGKVIGEGGESLLIGRVLLEDGILFLRRKYSRAQGQG